MMKKFGWYKHSEDGGGTSAPPPPPLSTATPLAPDSTA